MIFTKDGKAVTQLTWSAPTARVDGSAYAAGDHKGYELGVSDPANASDGFTPFISVPAAYNITSWPLSQLNMDEAGAYEVALRTVDAADRRSDWSNPLVYSAEVAPPGAPVGLSAS